MKIALAQINPLVGDLSGNVELMRSEAYKAVLAGASVVLFPELSLTGYPPEDLLLFPSFIAEVEGRLQALASCTDDQLLLIVGTVGRNAQGELTNEAVALGNGQVLARYAKQSLPNYGVFDEKRYFVAGSDACVVEWKGSRLGLLVCEDCWVDQPALMSKAAGAQVLLSLHASPYEVGKSVQREAVIRQRVLETGLPLVYVNQVGGQDALVFDGCSFVMDADGETRYLPMVKTGMALATIEGKTFNSSNGLPWLERDNTSSLPDWEEIWLMLVLGLGDYVQKNGFKGVLLGLSGGLDSAVVLTLAVDALGAEAVEAVMMPFTFTSDISKVDAALQAERLAVKYTYLPIEPTYQVIENTLAERFKGLPCDVTEENLQARIRGVLLMALSNKTGKLLLSTSNKSESAMGYATLYGDMNGGFAPLKDVPKSWVYALAQWRNQQGNEVIPQRVIERPASAELRPNQTDQDTLPPYDVLDQWLVGRMELNLEAPALAIATGISEQDEMLLKSMRLLRLAEYKRRQSAPGIKITRRSFDKDWRMPITNGWKG